MSLGCPWFVYLTCWKHRVLKMTLHRWKPWSACGLQHGSWCEPAGMGIQKQRWCNTTIWGLVVARVSSVQDRHGANTNYHQNMVGECPGLDYSVHFWMFIRGTWFWPKAICRRKCNLVRSRWSHCVFLGNFLTQGWCFHLNLKQYETNLFLVECCG